MNNLQNLAFRTRRSSSIDDSTYLPKQSKRNWSITENDLTMKDLGDGIIAMNDSRGETI